MPDTNRFPDGHQPPADPASLAEVVERGTTLSQRERQTVILAVGATWESGHELSAHAIAALNAGLTPEQVDTLANGQLPEGLTAREQIGWQMATALTTSRTIDQPLHDEAVRLLGTHGLSETLHLIGAYQVVFGFLNTFDLPVPEPGRD